jgi:hypothetical protein
MKISFTLLRKITILAVFLPFTLLAQIPAGYYSNAEGKNSAELKSVLHNIIKGHTAVSYTPGVWNAFQQTDKRADAKQQITRERINRGATLESA